MFDPVTAPPQCLVMALAVSVTGFPLAVKLGGNSCATVSGCGSDSREAMWPYGPREGLGDALGVTFGCCLVLEVASGFGLSLCKTV